MAEVIAQRDLRNDVSAVLRRVADGESFTVTVRGEPVAELVPVRRPRVFVPRDEVQSMFGPPREDPTLLDDLRALRSDVEPDGTDRAERLFGA